MVSLLADGLVAAGHDVTLFASGDSRTSARLASIYERAPSARIGQAATELNHALSCLTSADEFDVVSDHSGLVAAALAGTVTVPVVHTVHGPLDEETAPIYEQIVRVAPELGLISARHHRGHRHCAERWNLVCLLDVRHEPLRRLPPAQGLTAMQEINVTAVTPPFMTVFFGTAALCVAVGVGAVVDWNGWASALVLIAAAVYLVGVIGVTAAFNVPRNNALATVDPAASDAAERWRRYDASWTAGNHVRTVACLAAATLLIIATRVG